MKPSCSNRALGSRCLLVAGAATLFLLAAFSTGCGVGNAQDDTPITIGDGSLTMESVVPWAKYSSPDGNTKIHPKVKGAVSSVVLTLAGKPQSFPYSGQRCEVLVTYVGESVGVLTNNTGRNLRVRTRFSDFHQGASPNILVHNNPNGKITHVKITRASEPALFDHDVAGGTQVAIHYR